MGFAAVIGNWRKIRENFRIARETLLQEQPDVLILIDYPSFNLQMAKFCRKHLPGTKICYYIPPKVWVWKRRRIHSIARLCDKVLGIFPFEPAFYARYGYECTYVGNPTAEEIGQMYNRQWTMDNGQWTMDNGQWTMNKGQASIAVLPGSRPLEVERCLTRMLEAARRFPSYRIVVSAAPSIPDSFYTPYLREGETLTRDTYSAVRSAQAAIVNSGTATLETALLGCPQVAVYQVKLPRTTGLFLRTLKPLVFSIPYFTLVNIIEGREVIKEYIADTFTADHIAGELDRLLTDEAYKKEMLAAYKHLSEVLGSKPASVTAAQLITSIRR